MVLQLVTVVFLSSYVRGKLNSAYTALGSGVIGLECSAYSESYQGHVEFMYVQTIYLAVCVFMTIKNIVLSLTRLGN